DRPMLLPALTEHLIGEVEKIAGAIPSDRLAVQWDVCQEVLAWEGYYEEGPVDFRSETLAFLTEIGDAVPAAIELGYHLCYGGPAPCPGRWRRDGMRHGPRRSGAAGLAPSCARPRGPTRCLSVAAR